MDLETLKRRSLIIKKVRSFFDKKNYLEIDTPLLSPNLIPESCLEVFQTEHISPYGSNKGSSPLWLIPSPELFMKKYIAQHHVNMYQICKCFRNGESCGHLHNPEFTMLEYYTMEADYMDSLDLTEELFAHLLSETDEKCLSPPFERITVAQAFEKWAGFDLFKTADICLSNNRNDEIAAQAHRLGLNPPSNLSVPALFDLIFIHAVEPNLRQEKPVALLDYPAFVSCLAKKSQNGQTAERWELYYDGIELANCFSEETNPQYVKEYFIKEAAEKEKIAIIKHNVDHDYWKMFKGGLALPKFPRCSGVAMGMDRLIMAMMGKKSIDSVLL